jgi:hypothetical protein
MAGIDNNTILYLRGDSFIDLSLNGYNVTNASNAAIIDGEHFGKALNLTVANQRLEVLDAVLPTDKFTIDWWELSKGVSTANTALVSTLDSRHTDTAIKGIIMGKSTASAGPKLWSTTPSQTGTWVVSEWVFGNVNTTNWVHRALVYDGNTFYAYENGKLFGTATCAGLAAPTDSHIVINGYRASTPCYNAHVENLRISNVVRWTGNFEPPTKPYTSVGFDIISRDKNNIKFSVTKGNVNESVSKVEVIVNNQLIQTLNNNFENIDCVIPESIIITGGINNIELRAYYYNDFYEVKEIVYSHTIDKLPEQPSFTEVINKITELKNVYSNLSDILYNILLGKGCNISDSDKYLTVLINKVEQFTDSIKNGLVESLIAKNIDCSANNTFDELIDMIDEIRYSPFADWAKANTWLVTGTCAALPTATYFATTQAYKGKIYMIGGTGTGTTVRIYDIKTNTWETGTATMPTGRYGHDSTIIDDKIYCIGGYNNLTTNQVYDITNNKWSTLANMTTGREYLTVDAVGTNIYAIGGSGSTTYLNTNQCYDTITNTWSTKANMTAAKYGHASGVIGTDVYCIGGYTGSYVRTNYCYNTLTNTWTTKTQLTAVRSDGDCVEANGKLYFIFGRSASSTYQRNTYCYDPVTNAWTTMTASTGVTSYGRALAYSNGMIFAFGGYNGSALTAVECYII